MRCRSVRALVVVAALCAGSEARAQDDDAPPERPDRPVSVGPYAEVGFGATSFLGEAKNYADIGPSFALRIGTDLFSWFSVGLRVDASFHEATVPPPPEGEYFQLYGGAAEGRLGFMIGPVGIFADGGAGGALISTNVLQKVMVLDPGEKFTLIFNVGGGLEYQLQNRHYAFGLAAEYTMLPAFDALQSINGRAYLRYTY